MDNVALSMICVAGIPLVIFIFLAPLTVISRIMSKRSTEHFSVVPYLMTLHSCLISAWYGMLLETIDVPMICGIGAVVEAAYVIVFIIYARTRKQRITTLALLALVLIIFAILALVPLLLLQGQKRNDFCTAAAAITTIAMYASPMVVMPRVLRTKSTEFMPFYVSMSLFAYATWTNMFSFHVKDYPRFSVVVFPMDLDMYWEAMSG